MRKMRNTQMLTYKPSRNPLLLLFLLFLSLPTLSQDYWQQRVEYQMDIDFDVVNHQFTGKQKLTYVNNSTDTLRAVYYHLYFNAFQPNSMMDERSRDLLDPDRRVQDRISLLNEKEIGYQQIRSLKQNGSEVQHKTVGTVLEVELHEPILPGETTIFDMMFEGQVPLQIRRSGRDSQEGIAYSMTQWYPKLAEYDEDGWHAYSYVAREFYAPWGDFNVNITIDKNYILAAGGVLQNPDEIGFGYSNESPDHSSKEKLTWRFRAENVHDFAWSADPDYKHKIVETENGTIVRLFYQQDSATLNWEKLPEYIPAILKYANQNFGEYPYPEFVIMQGGDGGMEYPMSTLVTGHRSLMSLVGVVVHEWMHSWYQGVLGSNEILYGWMDEGFTEWAQGKILRDVFSNPNDIINKYAGYTTLALSGYEEPLSTPADYFKTNYAYGANYSKGALTLYQLEYIIGEKVLAKGMLRYFNEWKFRHPDKMDFIRIIEDVSGIELDWYFNYWINTTNRIDYGVKEVSTQGRKTTVSLGKFGEIPMPIDVRVTTTDGDEIYYYIPLREMRGSKAPEADNWNQLPDWPWTHRTYSFEIDIDSQKISEISLDPLNRMADVVRKNNIYKASEQ